MQIQSAKPQNEARPIIIEGMQGPPGPRGERGPMGPSGESGGGCISIVIGLIAIAGAWVSYDNEKKLRERVSTLEATAAIIEENRRTTAESIRNLENRVFFVEDNTEHVGYFMPAWEISSGLASALTRPDHLRLRAFGSGTSELTTSFEYAAGRCPSSLKVRVEGDDPHDSFRTEAITRDCGIRVIIPMAPFRVKKVFFSR